ncbi:MAG: DUF362 domain-containing protein [Bacteroidales bacterium]|jgi:uncharacterized Fe-S center protein|nr:DUF362 domain-containing protein [Bacteroidales bacterium]
MFKKTILFCCLTMTFNVLSAQTDSATVYFTRDISPEGVMKLFAYIQDNVNGKVGIKVHFGEEGNQYFVPASMVEKLCLSLDATLIETNVAYTGKRRTTESHIQLAREHGFTFAPIDILDEGGTLELDVVGGRNFKKARIGKNIDKYETIIYFSHFKGHGSAGFGGCIKNASMGMATPEGKKAMHFNDYPATDTAKCIKCAACVSQCPANAISLNPVMIDRNKCIACGKCVSVCPAKAIVNADNLERKQLFLERLVEYAKTTTAYKNSLYINIIINVSPDCDCSRNPKKPFISDIGILASTDIVAIEAAAHDLVDQAHSCDDAFLKENSVSGKHQINYAESMRMGTKKYRLISIDK